MIVGPDRQSPLSWFDELEVWVRQCTTCGLIDCSWRFSSPDEGSDYGIWQDARRCRQCGEVGFDLIQSDLSREARRSLRPPG